MTSLSASLAMACTCVLWQAHGCVGLLQPMMHLAGQVWQSSCNGVSIAHEGWVMQILPGTQPPASEEALAYEFFNGQIPAFEEQDS